MARKYKGEDLPKAKVTKESLKKVTKLFKYLAPNKWKFILGMIFLFLTGLTALAFPLLMGELINNAQNLNTNNVNKVGLILLIVFSIQAISSYFRVSLFVNVTENMLAAVRQDTYRHLISLPMTFFANRRVGELNSRISSDLVVLQDTFTTTIAEFIRQAILIIGGIAFLVYTSAKLTVIMLSIVPVLAIVAVFFGRYIRKISRSVQDKTAESNTIVEETLQGIANVKAFANEYFETIRYTNSTNEVKNIAIKGGKARGAFASFVIFCLFGAIVFVIWRGAQMVSANTLLIGSLFQFVLYSVFVGASIGGIAELYAQIQRAIGASERIFEILDEETEELDIMPRLEKENSRLQGVVKFNNVKFSYPGRKDTAVLKGVSFEINKGEMIAIVGSSGAGKSTIASLLLRFYNIDEGEISIDDKKINSFNLTGLRNQMAIVPQDVLLFGGTIKENIAYGDPSASMDAIIEAAKKANAHDFIESFPEKYDTIVGERGIKLSGGQRQRLAIARAVLKDPAILILDEATSALDSESEKLVQDALDKLMQNRTSVVIAHRLSTIKSADRIIVINDGIVAEQGNHEELLKKEAGLYKQLNKLQFDGKESMIIN